MRASRPDPLRAALLLVDLQEYFRPVAAPILPALIRLVARCRARGVAVLHTQHGHAEPSRDGGMLWEHWGDLIIEGTPAWALLPELEPRRDEPVFAKRRYSAFHGTALEPCLSERGITDLIIGGVMTNLCCETTARDAFLRDFRVFFLHDGNATFSSEYHQATLMNIAYGFGTVVGCEELFTGVRAADQGE